jgi:hypothetical protein
MSIINKKKKVFGKIAAARTLTEGLPLFKLTSLMPSINNRGNSVEFLSDLTKSLVGYEALVKGVVDTLTYSLDKIENELKKAMKQELKNIVNCGVNPSTPSWLKSNGAGIIVEVDKLDFLNILKIDPASQAGRLIYSDITPIYTNSSDFNTFLYGVIQNDGTTFTWQNIYDITFNSLGNVNRPNNSLTIKTNQAADNQTLNDINTKFIDTTNIVKTENVLNQTMDILYGTISSNVNKSIRQLEREEKLNMVIDKIINNDYENVISDDYFVFSNEEVLEQQSVATNRRRGIRYINTSEEVETSVTIDSLTEFNQDYLGSTSTEQRKNAIKNNLNRMANDNTDNITNPTDNQSVKLNFIQLIVNTLTKSIINLMITPKNIFLFIINYKIIYGQNSNFTDSVDFIKKNKNLFNTILKKISGLIIGLLLSIVLKRISELVAASIAKKQKEKQILRLSQLQSLVGIPINKIKDLLSTL